MTKLIITVVIAYFVTLGAQLVAFSLLTITLPLWQNLLLGLVFTLVVYVLKGGEAWTHSASDNSSTNETASTATS